MALMPFRRGYRNVGKSDKHEVTWSNLAENASAQKAITLSTCVNVGDKDASTEVAVGSHIKSIYIETNLSAQVTAEPKTMQWLIQVIMPGMTAQNSNLYYQDVRSYVIKRGMEMLPDAVATVFKRIFVVRIPRIYQRQKKGQVIQLRYISSSVDQQNYCGFAIYKELY